MSAVLLQDQAAWDSVGVVPRTWLIFALVAGCATTSDQSRLRAECQRDPGHDPRCLELLTAPEEYESRKQVMAAEEARKAKEFETKLAKMRREEEERQLRRIKSSSTSGDLHPDEMEEIAEGADDEDVLILAAAQRGDDDEGGGSSVRAVEKAPPPEDPIVLEKPKLQKQRLAPPVVLAGAPTPEAYMRGARCMLRDDLRKLKESFSSARIGELAVLIVDAQALTDAVGGEMKHRRLKIANDECKAAKSGLVQELLRTLIGPVATDMPTANAYSRGLARLRKELEVRAGLPAKQ